MVDNNRMGSGGAQQAYKWRNTEIRIEIKMQGIELYKKIEELQLQMDTVLTTWNSFKANMEGERERRERECQCRRKPSSS
jgi:hypothetical protein